MSKFLFDWAGGIESMLSDFQIEASEMSGYEVLVASYTYEDYSGDAYVLLRHKDGDLYEVHGGHCSCYGLEGQFVPERAHIEAIDHKLRHGYFSYINGVDRVLKDAIREALSL